MTCCPCKHHHASFCVPSIASSGDITDAKMPLFDLSARGQIDAEWQAYSHALSDAAQLIGKMPWLDVRGNHDAFNVPYYGNKTRGTFLLLVYIRIKHHVHRSDVRATEHFSFHAFSFFLWSQQYFHPGVDCQWMEAFLVGTLLYCREIRS